MPLAANGFRAYKIQVVGLPVEGRLKLMTLNCLGNSLVTTPAIGLQRMKKHWCLLKDDSVEFT